jgi:hypothetical protein
MLLYPSLESSVTLPLYTPVLFMIRASENELPSTPEASPNGSFSGMSMLEDGGESFLGCEAASLDGGGSEGGWSASSVEKLQLQYWTSLPTASGGGDGIGGWGALPMQILRRGGGGGGGGAIQSANTAGASAQPGEFPLGNEKSNTNSSSVVFAATLVFPIVSGSYEATARVGISSDSTANEVSGAWRWLGKPNENTKMSVQAPSAAKHSLLPEPSYRTMSRLSEAMAIAAIALSKQSQAALLLKGAGGQRRNSYGSSRSYLNENLAAAAAAASAAAAAVAASNPAPLKPLTLQGSVSRSYHLPVSNTPVQLPSISHHQALLLDSLALSPSTVILPKHINNAADSPSSSSSTSSSSPYSSSKVLHSLSTHSPQIRAATLSSSSSSPNLLSMSSSTSTLSSSSPSSSSSAGALRQSFVESASVVYSETAASLSMRASSSSLSPSQGANTAAISSTMNTAMNGVGQSGTVTSATINEISYVSALISILVSNWSSTSSTSASDVLGGITESIRGGGSAKQTKKSSRGRFGGSESEKSFTALVQLIACLPVLRQPAVRTKFVSKILGIEMNAAVSLLEGVAGLPLEVVLNMSSPAREARLAARRTVLCRNAIASAVSGGGGGVGGGGGLGGGGIGVLGALSRNFKQYMSSSSSAASAVSTMSPKSSSDSPKAGGGMSAGVSPYLGPGSMSPYIDQPVSPIASLGGGGVGGKGPQSPKSLHDDSNISSSSGAFVTSPVKPFVLAKLPLPPGVPVLTPLAITSAQMSSISASPSPTACSNFAYVSLEDIEDVFDEDGLEDADILAKLSPYTSAMMARRIAALRKTESKVISRASSRASMRQRPLDVTRSPARGGVSGGSTFDNIDIGMGLQSPSSSSFGGAINATAVDINQFSLSSSNTSSRSTLHSPTLRSVSMQATSPMIQSIGITGRPPLHSDAIFMLPAPSSPTAAAASVASSSSSSSSPRNLTLTASSSSFRPPAFLSPSSSGASISNGGGGIGGGFEKRSLSQLGIGGGNTVVVGGGGGGGLSARPFETTFFCSVMSTRQRALHTLVEWASGQHWRLLEASPSNDSLNSPVTNNTININSNSSYSSSMSSATSNGNSTSTSVNNSMQDQLEAMSLELCINALHHISPAYVHKRTVEVIVSSACSSRAGSSARIYLTRGIRILFGKGAVCGPEPVLMRACYPVLVTALPNSAGGRGVGGGGGAGAAAVAASSGLSTCITLRAVPNLSRVVAQCISESLFSQLYENRSKKKTSVEAEILFSSSEVAGAAAGAGVGGGGGGGSSGGTPSISEHLVPSPPHIPTHPPHLSSVSSLSPPRTAIVSGAVSVVSSSSSSSLPQNQHLSIHLPRSLDFREHLIGSPVVPHSSNMADKGNSPSRSNKGGSNLGVSNANKGLLLSQQQQPSPQPEKEKLLATSRIETQFDFTAICALMADLVLASCAHSARSEMATSALSPTSSSSSSTLTTTSAESSGVIDSNGPPPRHHGGLVKRRSASRANMVASPPRDQQHDVAAVGFPSTMTTSLSPPTANVGVHSGTASSAISTLLVGSVSSPGLSVNPPRPPHTSSPLASSGMTNSSSSSSPPFSASAPPTGHHLLSGPLATINLSGAVSSPVPITDGNHNVLGNSSLPKERLTRLWFDATRALALASLCIPVVPDTGVGATPEFRSVAACTLRICSVNDTLRDVFLVAVLRSWPKDASDSEAALLEVIHQILLTSLSSNTSSTTTSSSSLYSSSSASSMVLPPKIDGSLRRRLVARLCRSLSSAHIRVARNALIVLFNPALQITSTSNRITRVDPNVIGEGDIGDHHHGHLHQFTRENESLKAKVVETLKIVSDKHWNQIVRASSAQHLSVLMAE